MRLPAARPSATVVETGALAKSAAMPPPPDPPPVVPGVAPVAPVVSGAYGAIVSAGKIALLFVLLTVVPMGIVAIYYFWDPPHAQTANKGLRVPSVSVVEDVVPPYPMSFPERTFKTQHSGRAKTPISTNSPSSSPSVDPDEIERARRQIPRSLPSRKK